MLRSAEIADIVRQAAADAGFDLVGIAPVEDAPELEYFPRWIADGFAAEMKYLEARDEQGRLKRASLAHAVPWARSVVVCAINYNTAHPYSTEASDSPGSGWISRYAWGKRDYHESVMPRLRQVEAALRKSCGVTDCGTQKQEKEQELVTRYYVDTGPIVERVAAKYAGIGWIGKNTCIINQKIGSWIFLGVILTSIDFQIDDFGINELRSHAPVSSSPGFGVPAPDRCGSCTRCIDACPTDALIAPYQLDSNKCIAYLTIEKRGSIPEELREGMGRHIFGCDICQDVCPWNRKAPATDAAEFQPRAELVNPSLEWLAEIGVEEFRRSFRESPVRRAKRSGLRRNAVIAMGNSRERKFLPLLEKLSDDEDEVVRESAAWAIKLMK
ncbi:MAG: tRNA epoxyqueuosine(34) reductase QueG [Candidatus Sulfotelmatobacter sp.]